MKDVIRDKKDSIDSDIDKYQTSNIMGSINMVMMVWDEIVKRTKRMRRISIVVRNILLKYDVDFNIGYIRTLRSLGMRLRKYNLYEKALDGDWDYRTILWEISMAERREGKNKCL